MTPEQILNIFTYHKPFGDQPQRYEILRTSARNLATDIMSFCPESRESTQAIISLQQAVMWANAAIALNEKEKE